MTAPDLDALEKLADRCSFGDPWYTEENLLGRQNFGQFLPQDRAFIAAANPATIKALIAELKEARGLLDDLVCEVFDAITSDGEAQDCKAAELADLVDMARHAHRAFLARNGKGEGQ